MSRNGRTGFGSLGRGFSICCPLKGSAQLLGEADVEQPRVDACRWLPQECA